MATRAGMARAAMRVVEQIREANAYAEQNRCLDDEIDDDTFRYPLDPVIDIRRVHIIRMKHHFSPDLVTRFLKRLKGTEGNIGEAARSLQIPRETIRVWRYRYPEFDEQCKVVMEKARLTQ